MLCRVNFNLAKNRDQLSPISERRWRVSDPKAKTVYSTARKAGMFHSMGLAVRRRLRRLCCKAISVKAQWFPPTKEQQADSKAGSLLNSIGEGTTFSGCYVRVMYECDWSVCIRLHRGRVGRTKGSNGAGGGASVQSQSGVYIENTIM